MFKARILQVPSYKLKHLDRREKQIKIPNEQIRIHIRSSKHKTYKVKGIKFTIQQKHNFKSLYKQSKINQTLTCSKVFFVSGRTP